MHKNMIEARGLVKRYDQVVALNGLDLTVPEGTILALLGPNGAGKTTAVSILTTLLEPDSGSATVAGADLLGFPREVRKNIGLSGQYAALDEHLTGFENLDMMRRRLDLAGALVAEPPVLFLDEPTTGLDPRSRLELWAVIRELVNRGTTLLLTTQYMEEADQLADDIVVIDHGREIAQGTADELKTMIGGERIEVSVESEDDRESARRVLARFSVGDVYAEGRSLNTPISGGASTLTAALRSFDEEGIELRDVGLRRPTLDDVFLSLTGHVAEYENGKKKTDTKKTNIRDLVTIEEVR